MTLLPVGRVWPRRPGCRSRPRRSNTYRAWRMRTPPRRCRCACKPGARQSLARVQLRPSVSAWPVSCARRLVGKAQRLQPPHLANASARQAVPIRSLRPPGCCSISTIRFQLAQEPGVEAAGGVDVLEADRPARIACAAISSRSGLRLRQCGAERVPPAIARRLDRVQTGQPGLHGAQPFCSASAKERPIAIASPTDFIAGGEQGRRAGEFLEGEAGDLDHHVVDRRLERLPACCG